MYRKISLFLFIFIVHFGRLQASHIAGGEFQLRYTGSGNIYNVFMTMYYDDINAQAGLFEADVVINVSVFSKSTNVRQRNVELRRQTTDLLNYTTNGCNSASFLRTRVFRYTGTVDLTGLFEPQGYYMSWERCCRNYETDNIVHQNFFGTYISGQVFYMELPPISILGVTLRNSSPIFEPVPSQYYCKDNLNVLDFSATDPDGDSLVYRISSPLKGTTSTATATSSQPQFPAAGPYDSIIWNTGYSVFNSIPGNPALSVNGQTGLLRFKPFENGLYAFAVTCEEYRNGVRIGQVRREFQFLVRTCPVTYPPSVGINPSNNGVSNTSNTNWGASDPDTIVVKLNKDTCYTIFVTDSSLFFNSSDVVNISFGKTNLPRSVLTFAPSRVVLTASSDTASMNMCFSTCDRILIERDSIYFLDIIVTDGDPGSCPRRTDTLKTYVYVDVEEDNDLPLISTSIDDVDRIIKTYTDSLTSFFVYGKDPDAFDIREIIMSPSRFRIEDFNMQFFQVYNGIDSVAYRFEWTPTCEMLNSKIDYVLEFTLKDRSCIFTHNVTTKVNLKLQDGQTELPNTQPSNLITPNGDSLNDCFYIPNIPPDNCTYIFRSVEIYNRWGARVYLNSDRNFQWCPDELSDGIYYYSIDITEKLIKGWIHVLR